MNFCMYCMYPMGADSRFCTKCGKPVGYRAPEYHLRPGTVLMGRFFIGASLGEGGFGITYVGRDMKLNIPVAVKEYYPNGFVNRNATVSSDVSYGNTADRAEFFEKGRERFLKEAQTLAMFSGERGIVSIRDFFEANNTAYIVMELLEGETLRDHVKRAGIMTPDETLNLLMPVMQTLKHVHKAGLIHRDISPDNIMLTKNGIKLLDFGAARDANAESHKSLSVMLKPGYAPEEQYRSKGAQGPWTDVYSLCATMYRCITGKRPDDSTQRLYADEVELPSKLGISIPPSFEKALMTGMSVLAKDRPQDIDALLALFDDKYGATIPVPEKEEPSGEATQIVSGAAVRENKGQNGLNQKPRDGGKAVTPPIPEEKGKKSRLTLITVLLLVLLGIAAMVAVLLLAGKSDDEQKDITVKIDAAYVTLEVGEGIHLEGYAEDEDGNYYTVEWSTDNESVAGVIDGYVVANSPGTANIYATYDGEEAVCEVTVVGGYLSDDISWDESFDSEYSEDEDSYGDSAQASAGESFDEDNDVLYAVIVEDENGKTIEGARVRISPDNASNISVSYAGTGALYEYIIDLGDYYGDIRSITFRGV